VRSVDEWKGALREALREARRARRAHAVAVIRETLAAIDNAEAAEPDAAPPVQHGVIAGGVPGLGAGEVPRRVLSAEAVTAIVEREIHGPARRGGRAEAPGGRAGRVAMTAIRRVRRPVG
jgi:hypothetical protein